MENSEKRLRTIVLNMSEASDPFEVAFDSILKTHPKFQEAIQATKVGGPMPSYMNVAGNKNDAMYQALNRFLYSQARKGRGADALRLIEPFMGNLGISLAIMPDEGVFGSDYDQVLPLLAEAIKERPEKVEFDPMKHTIGAGEEPQIFYGPSDTANRGHDELYATLPEITEADLREAEEMVPGSVKDGRMFLPVTAWGLRASINHRLDKLRAGELGDNELNELLADVQGYSRIAYKSIWRTNDQDYLSIPTGGKTDKGALSAGTRAADYLEGETGKRKGYSGLTLDGGISYKPQDMNWIGGDLEPWDVSPWSAPMTDWHFQQGDFDSVLSDMDFRPTGLSGDMVFLDSPYGEEAGQHNWKKTQNNQIYDWMKRFGNMGIPAVAYNDASNSTIDAIKDNRLPLSFILSRSDKLAAAQRKGGSVVKPETMVTQNIPGVESDFMGQFMRDIQPHLKQKKKGAPFEAAIDNRPDYMLTGATTADMERKGARSVIDPMNRVRSWMVSHPEAIEQILSQPRYQGRQIA